MRAALHPRTRVYRAVVFQVRSGNDCCETEENA